ncbi:MAG: hypothetical protein ACOC1V_01595 [Candidatus Saliniplasma sp.]
MKRILALITAFIIFSGVTGVVTAQEDPYSDFISDGTGDVEYQYGTGWMYDVERPDIDIVQAELSESQGDITVSLTVKGTISSHSNLTYSVYLGDESEGFYMITFNDGVCSIWASNDHGYSMYEVDVDGVGTDTLVVTTTLTELLNPDELWFDTIFTYDNLDYNEYYWDYFYAEDPPDDGFVPVDHQLYVYPEEGSAPLSVTIEVEVENIGDESGEVPVTVDGDVIHNVDLPIGECATKSISHTFDDPGTYAVIFGSETVYVTVDDEPVDPGTPYHDVVSDPEDDVIQMVGESEDDWEFTESPDIDITNIEISESNSVVTLSITVKGTITDHPEIFYEIFLTDGDEGEIDIWYNNGDSEIDVYIWSGSGGYGNNFEPDTTGVGTDTLEIEFGRAQIGDPEDLLIAEVAVYNEGELMVDLAGHDAEYPPGYSDPGDDDDDDTTPSNGDNGGGSDDDDDTTPSDSDDGDDTESENIEEETPGFTVLLVFISSILAVLIYKKKEEMKE